MAMAQQRAKHCPFPHDIASGRPRLGVSLLVPSPNPRPLLGLLGDTDQELQERMAKGHPYIFNMGHGKSFQDYKEAANALMERNMQEVLHNRQTGVVFIPESHLPKVPRAVDFWAYGAKKRKLSVNDLAAIGMAKGTEDINNAIGDIAERHLAEELRKFLPMTRWSFSRAVLSECQARAREPSRSTTL